MAVAEDGEEKIRQKIGPVQKQSVIKMETVMKPKLESYMLNARRNPDRPLLASRWGDLQSFSADARQMIADMQEIYEDTGHPKALAIIQQIERDMHEKYLAEEFYQSEEINEVLRRPHLFPSAVVSWIKFYRDKENEL